MQEASGCERPVSAAGYWVWEASRCGSLVGVSVSGRGVGVNIREASGCGRLVGGGG